MRGFAGGGLLRRKEALWGTLALLLGAVGAFGSICVHSAEGEKEAVVAGHEAAVVAGMEILGRGGTAMDAAVTVSLMLGLAEPYGSGLGGKLAMLYWEASAGEATYIEALDASGENFDADGYKALSLTARQSGGGAVAVPGLLRGLETGQRIFGRLPWRDCVWPVVVAARDGVEVTMGMEPFFAGRVGRIAATEAAREVFMPGGRLPVAGDRLRNPDLAQTLEWVAEGGADAFYTGELAERLAAGVREAGGHLTAADFAAYEAIVQRPLRARWRGMDVLVAGPPVHGGVQFLMALHVLEAMGALDGEDLRSVAVMDRVARAFRSVYPRVQEAIADVPDAAQRVAGLLSEASVAGLAEEAETAGDGSSGRPDPDGGSTTHFVVWDGAGNIACVTQSLSHHFGSGVVVPGTGVLLNNSLTNFSLSDSGGVNAAAARKRPRSTICPVLVLRDGEPVAALGLPGGGRIPTATVNLFLDRWVFGQSMESAIAAQRFHLVRDPSPGPVSNTIALEGLWPEPVRGGLEAAGWQLKSIDEPEYFGGFCVVERQPDGRLRAHADLRRPNFAQAR